MGIIEQNETVIRRLTINSDETDRLNLRLRFEQLFGSSSFLSEGLPPKAIVCIRKLRDPAPRTLSLRRHDPGLNASWQNEVKREVEKLYRQAYRPVRETVPPLAESVIFADQAELMVCLARDWCRGTLNQNWWWQNLFPNYEQAETVARMWAEEAEFAPAALRILAEKLIVAEFAAKLSPARAEIILRQIIRVFGLNELEKALFEPIPRLSPNNVDQPTGSKPGQLVPGDGIRFSSPTKPLAPWEQYVPEARAAELGREQKALLGIGLLLVRSPRVIRSGEFARQIGQFRRAAETEQSASPVRRESARTPKTELEGLTGKYETKDPVSKKLESKNPTADSEAITYKGLEQKRDEVFEDSERDPAKSTGTGLNYDEAEIRPTSREIRNVMNEDGFEDKASERRSDTPPDGTKIKQRPAPEPEIITIHYKEASGESPTEFEFVIETQFGGVFYLLNLGLYLRLYSDFSEPVELELELSIWDFAAFLSLQFLGPQIKADPVWQFFGDLAGRDSGEEPGSDFDPPDEWRIPNAWLETFQTNQPLTRLKEKNRLVIRHPVGFCVIDVPVAPENPDKQFEEELLNVRKYLTGSVGISTAKISEVVSPAERWLKNLSEYADARICQAIGTESRDQTNKRLFRHRASIEWTATNLDATFQLADLPFEVRSSGLDRNPGWIPAAGRYIKFHYV